MLHSSNQFGWCIKTWAVKDLSIIVCVVGGGGIFINSCSKTVKTRLYYIIIIFVICMYNYVFIAAVDDFSKLINVLKAPGDMFNSIWIRLNLTCNKGDDIQEKTAEETTT